MATECRGDGPSPHWPVARKIPRCNDSASMRGPHHPRHFRGTIAFHFRHDELSCAPAIESRGTLHCDEAKRGGKFGLNEASAFRDGLAFRQENPPPGECPDSIAVTGD